MGIRLHLSNSADRHYSHPSIILRGSFDHPSTIPSQGGIQPPKPCVLSGLAVSEPRGSETGFLSLYILYTSIMPLCRLHHSFEVLHSRIIYDSFGRKTQGDCVLIAIRQDFEQIVFAQSRLKLFSVNADLCCFLLFEQVESNVAQDGKVFRGLIFADAAVVFLHGHIRTQCSSFSMAQCRRQTCKIRWALLGSEEM